MEDRWQRLYLGGDLDFGNVLIWNPNTDVLWAYINYSFCESSQITGNKTFVFDWDLDIEVHSITFVPEGPEAPACNGDFVA